MVAGVDKVACLPVLARRATDRVRSRRIIRGRHAEQGWAVPLSRAPCLTHLPRFDYGASVASHQSRLVLIGLDAADRGFIARHPGLMPNVSRILADGDVGDLAAEALPGAVWPSFCTGTRSPDHGIYHHMQWDPGRMSIRRMTGDWLPSRPFWRDLGERGVRVTAFDVPFVFPGPSRDVLEVMNWGRHDNIADYWANDEAIGRRIRREFGLSPMGFEITVDKTREQLEG